MMDRGDHWCCDIVMTYVSSFVGYDRSEKPKRSNKWGEFLLSILRQHSKKGSSNVPSEIAKIQAPRLSAEECGGTFCVFMVLCPCNVARVLYLSMQATYSLKLEPCLNESINQSIGNHSTVLMVLPLRLFLRVAARSRTHTYVWQAR